MAQPRRMLPSWDLHAVLGSHHEAGLGMA